MARVRARHGIGLALTLLFVALGVHAEPARTAERGSRERALITLTAAAAENAELHRVLNELLARDEIDVRFAKRARFGSDELLRVGPGDNAVEAFVVPDGNERARLYFRAPDGQRFLARDVALPSGLDAVGRELIAQIVETSIVALLHSPVGISRAQLKAEVESRAEPAQSSDAAKAAGPNLGPSATVNATNAAPKTAPAAEGEPAQVRARAPLGWAIEGWFGAHYAADWSGSALGLRQGPAVELGIGLRRRIFVRARLMLERDFAVTLQAGPLDAKVTTERWRALVDLGTALGSRQALALSVGAGEDSSYIEPTASRDALVLPAAPFRETPFVLSAAARLETSVAPFRFALAVGVDVPLVQTPYDIDRGAAARQLAAPWAVRPGAVLSGAWCPRLGAF
ncbi:MAG TPA: hypothetical protein VGL19_10205 [Polyangiaceae bacterium]